MNTKEMTVIQRKVELKALSDDGTFEGFAAVYGNTDFGGDIIKPGAFTKTIQESNRKAFVLDEHKFRVGAASLADDPFGLKTVGRLNLESRAGKDAYSDLKFYQGEGMQMGMSIGYMPVPGKSSRDEFGVRTLTEVKLFEVTLTTTPMNELARVTRVKSLDDPGSQLEEIENLQRELKAGRKISKADAARMLAIYNDYLSLLEEAGIEIPTTTSAEEPNTAKSVEPDYHSLLSILEKFSIQGVK